MDNGLIQGQASEVLTHIAFYAGWPNAFSALSVVKMSSKSDRNNSSIEARRSEK
jgi:alkylhydroperoxidase/carboxymuconolactone decarboxylase family protein YurZ